MGGVFQVPAVGLEVGGQPMPAAAVSVKGAPGTHVESAPHIHVLHLEMHGETPLSFETVRKTQIALVAEVDSATGRPFGSDQQRKIQLPWTQTERRISHTYQHRMQTD